MGILLTGIAEISLVASALGGGAASFSCFLPLFVFQSAASFFEPGLDGSRSRFLVSYSSACVSGRRGAFYVSLSLFGPFNEP